MKSCPKCSADYFDDALEFCLEDGSRLTKPAPSQFSGEIPTIVGIQGRKTSAPETEILPNFKVNSPFADKNFEYSNQNMSQRAAMAGNSDKVEKFKDKITYQGNKVIETAPIVFALAHNYWQWLYLSKPNSAETYGFLTSAAFLTWLILLFFGSAVGFLSLKFGKNKIFAVTSLVILAINLLLFIVPRK